MADEDWQLDNYLRLLRSSSSDDRNTAASGLGSLRGDRRAVQPLVSALLDRDWNVRFAAAKSLGAIGDKSAIEGLYGALHTAVTGQFGDLVQARIVISLGELGEQGVIDKLLEISKSGPNSMLQKRASEVIVQLRQDTKKSSL